MDGETIYSVYDHSGQLVFRDNATTGEETDYISAAGMSIVRVTNDVPTWIASDHLGSASKGLDSSGNVIWEERYSPYGERLMQPAANDNHTGFTGHVEDAATGLTYMQARYYDPVIGRFLSTDPVQFVPDRPDMFNRYAYAANDPVNMIDPDGEIAFAALANPAVRGAIGFATGAAVGALVNAGGQVIQNGGFDNFSVGSIVGAAGGAGTVSAAVAVNPTLAANPAALAALGGTTGAAGSAAGDVIDGQPVDKSKALGAAIGGAVGAPGGAALAKGVVGEFASAGIGEATGAVAADVTNAGDMAVGIIQGAGEKQQQKQETLEKLYEQLEN